MKIKSNSQTQMTITACLYISKQQQHSAAISAKELIHFLLDIYGSIKIPNISSGTFLFKDLKIPASDQFELTNSLYMKLLSLPLKIRVKSSKLVNKSSIFNLQILTFWN